MSLGVETWTEYLVGVALFGCGFAVAIHMWKQRGLEKELRSKGYSVVARIVGVICVDLEDDGYAIEAEYRDTRRQRTFRYTSQRINYDPSALLRNRQDIRVFVDRQDPGRYVVDTSFLPDR